MKLWSIEAENDDGGNLKSIQFGCGWVILIMVILVLAFLGMASLLS